MVDKIIIALGLGVALAMDAFAVSMSNGLRTYDKGIFLLMIWFLDEPKIFKHFIKVNSIS